MSPLEFPHILSTEALTASVLVCVFKGVAQWTASEDKDRVSLWSGLGRLAYCSLQKTQVFYVWGSSAVTQTHRVGSICKDPCVTPEELEG